MGKDPSRFQWFASIIIPAIGVVASVGVLWFSWWTANKARKEAKASEAARVEERDNHLENERRARLTSRLADILDELPEMLEALRIGIREERVSGAKYGVISVSPLIVRVVAASLEANEEERNMLKQFRELLLGTEEGRDAWLQSVGLTLGSDLLVEWVHSAAERRAEVLSAMSEVASATTADDVRAIRRRILPKK